MSSVSIIDGGMGGELLARGLDRSNGLWSAEALLHHPDMVADVHRDYVAAGARYIITNTYSTIPSYLAKAGLADRFEALADQAGRIAREVADAAEHPVTVVGSIPPLDESYRPDLVPDAAVAKPIYEALTRALNPYVDAFVCETMSRADEAVTAVSAVHAASNGQPVWVAWTLAETPGEGLRSGESVEQAYAAVAELEIASFLFNCTSPAAITAGLATLRKLTSAPLGAYPNRLHIPAGWTLDNEVPSEQVALSEDELVGFAEQWVALGASLIGGCCGVGPTHIRALAQRFAA